MKSDSEPQANYPIPKAASDVKSFKVIDKIGNCRISNTEEAASSCLTRATFVWCNSRGQSSKPGQEKNGHRLSVVIWVFFRGDVSDEGRSERSHGEAIFPKNDGMHGDFKLDTNQTSPKPHPQRTGTFPESAHLPLWGGPVIPAPKLAPRDNGQQTNGWQL